MDAEAGDVKPAEKPKKKKLEQSFVKPESNDDMTPMRKKAKQQAQPKIEDDEEDFAENMIQQARDKRKAGKT